MKPHTHIHTQTDFQSENDFTNWKNSYFHVLYI